MERLTAVMDQMRNKAVVSVFSTVAIQYIILLICHSNDFQPLENFALVELCITTVV